MNLVVLGNGIRVPKLRTAFSARIQIAVDSIRFHSFGCESGFMDTLGFRGPEKSYGHEMRIKTHLFPTE